VALGVFVIFDVAVIIFLFAMIFRFLPDAEVRWRDVWIGASLTALLFYAGKFVLGLYLASGVAGSAYGAASSMVTRCSFGASLHRSQIPSIIPRDL
jgi:membrane protein